MSLREAPLPRGLILDEAPAPRRMAPFAAALTAETEHTAGGSPAASGRLVLLHDPSGQEAWDGDFRVVMMVRACLDEDMSSDPALGTTAWSWLLEALATADAEHHALVGTVSRVLSDSFGGLTLTEACTHIEIRASWTPATPDLDPHLRAWYELIHVAAGNQPELAHPLALARTTS